MKAVLVSALVLICLACCVFEASSFVASVPAKNNKKATTKRKKSGARGVTKDATEDGSQKKKKKRRKKKTQGPFYWRNEKDIFMLRDELNAEVTTEDEAAHMIRFQVRGPPRPLSRHRTAKGFMYNPSSAYQTSFRKVVHDMVWTNVEKEVKNHEPLFGEEHQLVMRLVFRMKRPKKHFVNNKPGPGRLRPVAPPRLSSIRTDIDNLSKFVLDSLNGLIYVDDRQVASIQATKLYDDEGTCEGCTEVCIQRLTEQDVDDLLQGSLPLSNQ